MSGTLKVSSFWFYSGKQGHALAFSKSIFLLGFLRASAYGK
jgi:hypothetical protein